MTKAQKKFEHYKNQINDNRTKISELLSCTPDMNRLNNLNWLRHEISYTEPQTLFYVPKKYQTPKLDFTCTKNLGDTYDYIINNPKTVIDSYEICTIHSMLTNGTYLNEFGGRYRNSSKTLEITVNGERYHAPDEYEIPSRMNDIIYNLRNSHESALNKAFTVHYQIIALQPFEDFNKRTARMVMNWILVQNGYRPIAFNKPSDKINYKNAIAAYMNGDRKTYFEYMGKCMIRTQNTIINLLTKSRAM